MLAQGRALAISALMSLPLVLTDGDAAAAMLALPLVLTDGRAAAVFATASPALVLTDAGAAAVPAFVPVALVLTLAAPRHDTVTLVRLVLGSLRHDGAANSQGGNMCYHTCIVLNQNQDNTVLRFLTNLDRIVDMSK